MWRGPIRAPSSLPATVELEGVTRSYGGVVALRPTTLLLPSGSNVAVVGRNGSGKSTLLRLLSGRDTPTAGAVLIAGRNPDEDSLWARRDVAVLPDRAAFYPDLTAGEHLWLTAASHGAGVGAWPLVDQSLARVSGSAFRDLLPSTLSSGQQQAVLIASLLVRPSRLMVLDEPDQRLDEEARAVLCRVLRDQSDSGTTVIYATHDSAVTSQADWVLEVRGGEVAVARAPRTTG